MFSEYLYVFVFLYILFNVFMTRCQKLFMFNPKVLTVPGIPGGTSYVNQWSFRWHHLYTGIAIVELGYYIVTTISPIGFFIILFGAYLIGDDLTQHIMQRQLNDPNYHTFGHKIGKPFYQFRRWLIRKTGWKWLGEL